MQSDHILEQSPLLRLSGQHKLNGERRETRDRKNLELGEEGGKGIERGRERREEWVVKGGHGGGVNMFKTCHRKFSMD